MDSHSSTELDGSDVSCWGGRASQPQEPLQQQAAASRTRPGSAEHTAHDQHVEQAEPFTGLTVLSKVCPAQAVVLGGSWRSSSGQLVGWGFFP